MTSLSNAATPSLATNEFFTPSAAWVRCKFSLGAPLLIIDPARKLALGAAAPHYSYAYLAAWPEDAYFQ